MILLFETVNKRWKVHYNLAVAANIQLTFCTCIHFGISIYIFAFGLINKPG